MPPSVPEESADSHLRTNSLLEVFCSSRRALVRLRFFVITALSVLAIAILTSSTILYLESDPPRKKIDYLRLKGHYSCIAVSSMTLLVHLLSLVYIFPLWAELLYTFFMSGSSIGLLIVWTLGRTDFLYSWSSDAQIGAFFTLWGAISLFTMAWLLSFAGLLIFALHYTHINAPMHYESSASWKYPSRRGIWTLGVCDVPQWPAIPGIQGSGVNANGLRIPLGRSRPNFKFWRTSDNRFLPLLMFSPDQGRDRTNRADKDAPPTLFSTFRGIIVLGLVVGFWMYLNKQLFVETYREGWSQPTQTNYGTLTQHDLPPKYPSKVVVLVGIKKSLLSSRAILKSAVNVTAMTSTGRNKTAVELCEMDYTSVQASFGHTMIKANCSYDYIDKIQCNDDFETSCSPDISVAIDYNTLGFVPGTSSYAIASAWIGYEDIPDRIVQTTPPIPLVNNMHIIGAYTIYSRRMYNTAHAFWGVFQSYIRFGVAETVIYGNNPDTSITYQNNTSSVLLLEMYDVSDWRIVSDTSVHSVLSGLSSLGGIYTAINTIFVLIFGYALAGALGFGNASLFQGGADSSNARTTDEGNTGGDTRQHQELQLKE